MLSGRVILLGLISVLATIATVTETTALLGNSTVYLVDTAPSAGDPLALGLQAPPVTDTPGSGTASHPEIPSVSFAGVLTALRVLWTITTTIAVGVVVALATLAGWVLVNLGRKDTMEVCKTTAIWWRGLAHYWWFGRSYAEFPFCADSIESRVYIRSIALAMTLWSLPHYRNGNFQDDMEKNLRNVAIPGTGVPLSFFCRSRVRFFVAVLVLAPIACLCIAVIGAKPAKGGAKQAVADRYAMLLLHPQDWFTLWRINCCLASYHAHVTGSADYAVEDKWTFLQLAEEKGIAVSPTLELPAIVCKDRNEEGGMGIAFYENARHGGDWILQKVLYNAPFVKDLLPKKAPLSTIRIVTASRVGLPGATSTDPTDLIEPLSCVLRLGREGALTDHDAILFDVDGSTGIIQEGTINKSWYKLGWSNATLTAPGGPATFTSHPDSSAVVTGKTIPGMSEIRALVKRAHAECCPEVPLCGWDVALTNEGTLLLEVNLSCNFFQATIDRNEYFCFVDEHFRHLEQRVAAAI